jgi:hypothetical protein
MRRPVSPRMRSMTLAVSGPDPSSAITSSKSEWRCVAYPHSDFSSQRGWL